MSRPDLAAACVHPDTPEPIRRLEGLARIHDMPLGAGHLRWRRFGDGPPLVLLHGGHGNWLHWARNIESLALGNAVWVADMPGYGDSAEPVEPAAMSSLVEGVAQSIEALLGVVIELAGIVKIATPSLQLVYDLCKFRCRKA